MQAAVPLQPPPSYAWCMKFIRDESVMKSLRELENAENISVADYNNLMYYVAARIVFSNGSRPEVVYKGKKQFMSCFNHDGSEWHLLLVPDAKCGCTTTVLSQEDKEWLDIYARVQTQTFL